MSLKTNDFDFNLPEELIATEPFSPRQEAKMLVCNDGLICDKKIRNLTDYIEPGDVFVFNDTKVIKAKLTGKRDDVKIEANLHKNLNEGVWQVMAKPAKKLKIGQILKIADDFFAKAIKKHDNGFIDLEFNCQDDAFYQKLEQYGQVPLPPYIKRQIDNEKDEINYQTIFAKEPGAVAAPTAGLHFTKELFDRIEAKGAKKAFVTLNVGAGTFLPVKSDLIKDHEMHEEYFSISQKACDIINKAKKDNKRIIGVGTTSLRVLESATDSDGLLMPQSRDTGIFIYPPYKFKMVDILMTNFHLPKSTLFMLISAFIGKSEAKSLYQHAIKERYRFYSYGDACLLFNH
jgi:S-adenosylmethionine:tRNA ribosyltransferase-isomerase